MFFRPRYMKPLRLIEIIEELECIDDNDQLPSGVAILPPENANADVTDEDSGGEEVVTWHNLLGSQLKAQADLIYSDDESFDIEHELPLSTIAKRRCTGIVSIDEAADPPEQTISNVTAPTECDTPLIAVTVPRNQKYQ
ncbi:piggyBac transposable element-derived protein 3-like [Pectinophora gossypiella]|uniref:piggyBac transposable element-derived protein 3-like n=1 Tax=Pectinophora gossypiella TaxID=13191 RepID=UPI00214F25D2|nr:piggyBac transposable element-derived protein 3-like [Pectinophora gossypiella]XP_049866863.1 piggyBac transposable element-derived protein 3-like [Pectinophora gossypiella]XP_049867111.1 piggyBac transposable element-derived protein 3-like [Pectinophora gossypiella]